jgi:regulator of replication initiation timing
MAEENKDLRTENSLLKKKLKDLENEIKVNLKECIPIKEFNNEGTESMTEDSVYQYFPENFKFRHIGHSYLSGINTSKLIHKQKLERLQKIINN